MGRNIRRLICGLLMLTVLAGVFTACSKTPGSRSDSVSYSKKNSSQFKEDIAGSVGEHIVYSYSFIDGKNISRSEEKRILNDLKEIDKTLDEGVYIFGYEYKRDEDRYLYYGQQYSDGITVPGVYYGSDKNNKDPNLVLRFEAMRIEPLPDASNLVEPETLFDQVIELSEQNTSDLYDYSIMGIYGNYLLCYDVDRDILVYDFVVNEFSKVIFDANTGEVIYSDFWDGVMVD